MLGRPIQKTLTIATAITAAALFPLNALAADDDPLEVTVHKVSDTGVGEKIGTIRLSNDESGLVIDPDLKGLSPGAHGFHVHQNPDCGPKAPDGSTGAAKAAGGHYDPADAGKHAEPWGEGHKGDMPVLVVDQSGNADRPVLAPRLTVGTVIDRAIVIHEGGDNYADEPEKLGGGGPRVACAVIKR
ncbi:MAG: superoxide dismutase [Cu-Zn] SodC1 [unclassified Hahellaceae]|nr:superoxide dismutase [Cu-Zn] SodC1 [Hahellaceae bacterium]|tara:strand:- start:75605 stop:76162 length:558 start_codon:yes stop_codon:yes gene_type:complete